MVIIIMMMVVLMIVNGKKLRWGDEFDDEWPH